MAINPAVLKAMMTAVNISRSEENRRTTLTTILVPVITILMIAVFVMYVLTSPLSFFASFIFGEELDMIDDLQKNYGFSQSLGIYETDYISGSSQSYEGVEFTDGSTTVMYYNQLDLRWTNEPYGTDEIGTHGCGPTAMAMVISSLTSDTMDPVAMSQWAYENGGWAPNEGSYHTFIPNCARAWGLPVQGVSKTDDMQQIVDALSSGQLVVAIMGPGEFTTGGHYIVLRGVTSTGKILVADPASSIRSGKEYDLSLIVNQSRNGAGGGGPFWIIGEPVTPVPDLTPPATPDPL